GPGSLLGCLPEHGRDPELIEKLQAGDTLRLVGGGHFLQQPIYAEDLAEMVAIFGLMFESAAIVMAAVGAIGLLSTLSMSVFERLREIGVMRSIGASSFTVTSQFLTEGMLVGMSAWIIAAPLSYLVGLGLIKSMGMDSFIEGIGYDPIALVVGLVGMVVITILASIGPSLGAARKTVSEILRYQ
ncbi:MAG: FtsX-like permease family protein, partial [SAR202 cluster bacterium]|nr:FtsX-like permease family protein [SAR202 cluster bacterium]